MKKTLVIGLLSLAVGVAFADVTHFTETLPPQTSSGAMPVSNGYDWSLSNGSNAPTTVIKTLSVSGTSTLTGAVTQSSTTLTGGLAPFNVTAAQELTLTPTTTGQVVFCTNCSNFNNSKGIVCVSTGIAVGSFVAMSSATAVTACQ